MSTATDLQLPERALVKARRRIEHLRHVAGAMAAVGFRRRAERISVEADELERTADALEVVLRERNAMRAETSP